MNPLQHASTCDDCPLGSRRRFLTETTQALAAATLAIGSRSRMARWSEFVGAGDVENVRVYPIPRSAGVTIDRRAQVIIVREAHHVFAFRLRCPHQNTPLRWRDDGWFQCPKHKSKYQPNGEFISGKATRGMDRYAIRREGNTVIVDLSRVFRQDDDAREWAAARITI
jgi:nitrite reductase/ring-hydroxylating ferredoxin subunit